MRLFNLEQVFRLCDVVELVEDWSSEVLLGHASLIEKEARGLILRLLKLYAFTVI